MPKLSVGLPVFNGAQYVARAIDSVLAQSVGDLELVVSDNASTDDTESICREKAAIDPRIVYKRIDCNKGSLFNFESVLRRSRGEFFFWAAHDDQWHPDFAARAIAALETVPSAAGAMGTVIYVDPDGRECRARDVPPYHLEDLDQGRRLRSYFVNGPTDTLVYGLFRTAAIAGAPFVPSTCPEKMIIAHAIMHGPILDVPGMEYTSLQVPKSHALVAETIGITKYNFENEARVFNAMTALLASGLRLRDLASVYPAFFFRNNWHKFFAKRLLGLSA